MNTTNNMYDEATPQGADKVRRYGWTQVDEPGEFRLLSKQQLHVDDSYQRTDVAEAKIKSLTAQWSWVACGAIVVAERGAGDYFVVDGQHRVLAAKRRSDIKQLPCLVYAVGSVSDEAKAFLLLNSNRKPVSALAKHKAAAVAGDETAVFVADVLGQLGITTSEKTSGPRQLKAIRWCKNAAEQDRRAFVRTLEVVRDLCDESGAAIHVRLLEGLFYLHRNVRGASNDDGALDDKRFLARLKAVGEQGLRIAAGRAAAYYARGGEKVFATGMLEDINKGLRQRFEFANGQVTP